MAALLDRFVMFGQRPERRRPHRLVRKLKKHIARAGGYANMARWLIRDYFMVVRSKLLPVVAGGAAHIAVKLAAMGVISFCVHSMAQDLPIDLPGLAALSPKSPEFVVLAIGVGIGLLIVATYLRYLVRRRGIGLGLIYEEFCARRVILLASRLPDPRSGDANRIFRSGRMHQYAAYARYCGATARLLTQLLPAFVSFVTVSMVMLWLDFWLTVELAALALFAVVAQYPANNRAAVASHQWERTRRGSMQRYMNLFRQLNLDPIPLAANSPILEDLYRAGPVRDNIDSFSERSTAAEQATLVSRIGSSLLLGGVLVLLGVDIVQGDRSWASVAAYVAAVRFALSDFVSVCKIASSLTKHDAQIGLYRDLVVRASPALEATKVAAAPLGWPLTLNLDAVDGSHGELIVERGDVLALVLPPGVPLSLESWFAAVVDPPQSELLYNSVLIDKELLAPQVDLRTNFGLSPEATEVEIEQALRRFLPSASTWPPMAPGWLDDGTAALWLQRLPDWAAAALRVIAARERGVALGAMEVAQFLRMPPEWRHACREAFAESVLLLVHRNVSQVGKHGERAAIFGDGHELRAWMTLADDGRTPGLAEVYERVTARPQRSAAVDAFEDDLE